MAKYYPRWLRRALTWVMLIGALSLILLLSMELTPIGDGEMIAILALIVIAMCNQILDI